MTVSFNGGYNNLAQYPYKDIDNLAKYTLGTTIVTPEEGAFSGMGMMLGIGGAMETFKMGQWAWNNKSNLNGKFQEGLDIFKTELGTQKSLFKSGGFKELNTYKNFWNNYSADVVKEAIPTSENLTKLSDKTQALYSKAKEAAELVKKNPTHGRRLLNIADAKLAEANKAARIEKLLEPAKGFGKVGRFLGKLTGISKLNTELTELATKSPLVSKFLKFGKGNGWFIAITGGIELITQVIPTFAQLGAAKGMKQLGKSTLKTGASVGGWVAGMAAGAAIGSIIPGAGTVVGGAIGALLGLAGGCLGSWAAGKVVEPLCESELDIAKEEASKKIAEEASKDPNKVKQLIAITTQKLQQNGVASEDAKIAFSSLQKLLKSQNENTQQYNTNPNLNTNSNPFSSQNYMDKDFMAMGAGLV